MRNRIRLACIDLNGGDDYILDEIPIGFQTLLNRRRALNRKTWLIAGLTFVIGVVGGIASRPTRGPDHSKSGERVYRMLVPYHSWPGWSVSARAMERLSKSVSGVHTALSGPDDGDTSKQIDELRVLIRNRVNGVILCPGLDASALIPAVKEAISSKIPVVTMYDDVPNSERLTFVTTDDQANARNFMRQIFAGLKPATENMGKVRALVCYMGPGIANQLARYAGVKDAAKEAPWVELVEPEVRDEANDVKAAEGVHGALIRERRNIQLIIGLNARSPIGAISALRELELKPGAIMVTGWDSDEDVLNGIKNGWIHAVCAPNAGFMTQVAVSVLEAYNLNYLYPDTLNLHEMDMTALPPRIVIEPVFIDRDNVDAYFRKR